MPKAVRGTRNTAEGTEDTAATLEDAVILTRKRGGNAATAATIKEETNAVGRTRESTRRQPGTYSAKRWTRSAEPSGSRKRKGGMPSWKRRNDTPGKDERKMKPAGRNRRKTRSGSE